MPFVFDGTCDVGFAIALKVPGLPEVFNYERFFRLHNHTVDESLRCGARTLFSQSRTNWIVEPISPRMQPGNAVLNSINGMKEVTAVYTALSRGIGCYVFQGDVLQRPQTSPVAGLNDDGQNYVQVATAILDDFNTSKDWYAIAKALSSLNPNVRSLDIKNPERNSLQVGYANGSKHWSLDASLESEGFRRYLAILLALYQTPRKPLILIEHPEDGIHPGALESLAGEFQRHVRQGRGQIILTTHSPQLLDYIQPEQIRVVRIEDQCTKIGPVSQEQLDAIRENLLHPGELLTVDPARLEGQLDEVAA